MKVQVLRMLWRSPIAVGFYISAASLLQTFAPSTHLSVKSCYKVCMANSASEGHVDVPAQENFATLLVVLMLNKPAQLLLFLSHMLTSCSIMSTSTGNDPTKTTS